MKKAHAGASLLLISGMLLIGLSACGGGGGQSGNRGAGGIGTDVTPVALGEPLADLSGSDLAAFQEGLEAFEEVEDRSDGLGPVFNGTSCAECHSSGAVGGAAPNFTVARVTRIGGIENGKYSDLTDQGGAVLQARSLQEVDPSCPVTGEVIPSGASFVSKRMTSPLFGEGLIEAIPESTILQRSGKDQGDGVRGIANFVLNPETSKTELGRFGWKAQVSSLRVFAADAYLNEMGITSPLFPNENLPQGQPLPPGVDLVAEPEDSGDDVEAFANFMRFLAPPAPVQNPSLMALNGKKVFNQIHCTACHVENMVTGSNAKIAFSQKNVRLYSDLLLHRMGSGLADGIRQGKAMGDQFRTPPLWGLSARRFFLHDGRASTIADAILLHGGEATTIRNRFMQLSPNDRAALEEFLNDL